MSDKQDDVTTFQASLIGLAVFVVFVVIPAIIEAI